MPAAAEKVGPKDTLASSLATGVTPAKKMARRSRRSGDGEAGSSTATLPAVESHVSPSIPIRAEQHGRDTAASTERPNLAVGRKESSQVELLEPAAESQGLMTLSEAHAGEWGCLVQHREGDSTGGDGCTCGPL
jgi:hypothetical protein